MGALNNATSTYLSTFANRGGKLIVYHGTSDPVFSAHDIMRWYDQTKSDTEGDFARLFMVPGMAHCGGGPALDNFDPLTALENWVEKIEPPAQIVATGAAFPGLSQPLCPYPQGAHLIGTDRKIAASYICK